MRGLVVVVVIVIVVVVGVVVDEVGVGVRGLGVGDLEDLPTLLTRFTIDVRAFNN